MTLQKAGETHSDLLQERLQYGRKLNNQIHCEIRRLTRMCHVIVFTHPSHRLGNKKSTRLTNSGLALD